VKRAGATALNGFRAAPENAGKGLVFERLAERGNALLPSGGAEQPAAAWVLGSDLNLDILS